MKILIATMPFPGHFDPLTSIAVRLKDLGHDVRWYAPGEYAPTIERLGIGVLRFQRARAVTAENISALFPERARYRGPKRLDFDFDKVFAAPARDHYLDIRDIRRDFNFELLACDIAFFAAKLVHDAMRVPVYAVNPGPAVATSVDVPPPFFGLKPARNSLERMRDRVVRSIVNNATRTGLASFNAALDAAGLPPITKSEVIDCMYGAVDRVFQTGIPEMDFPRSDMPRNVRYVGALLPARPASFADVGPRIRDWPGPVVAVSQGTVDNRDPSKLVIPTMQALAGTETLVVALTAGQNTERLRAEYPESNVMVEDFLAFDALFPHTDAFVTNGGHGSVMLALHHRVPMLVAGTREGKNDINARLAYNGLAVDLRTEKPSTRQVRSGLEHVMTDAAQHERIRHVGSVLDSYDALALLEEALATDFVAR
ncbi:glycosyltransferase [Glaciibacter sp. 2TAF33]|uniref:glycosyltransferase n=1 Tax=Glaciibacter sp. 2TAF33 TaxID=3233015 RepID=UPI003F8E4C59